MRKLDVKNNFSGGAVIVDNVQVDIPLDASYTAFYAVTLELSRAKSIPHLNRI